MSTLITLSDRVDAEDMARFVAKLRSTADLIESLQRDGAKVMATGEVNVTARYEVEDKEPAPEDPDFGHGFTCGLCQWGRDRVHTHDEYLFHMTQHPEAVVR
jgi:hypothetical protein